MPAVHVMSKKKEHLHMHSGEKYLLICGGVFIGTRKAVEKN